MTSVVAKVVYKFWPQWGDDVLAQFKKYDPEDTGRVPRHVFFNCMTACGLDLTTIVSDKLFKEYGDGTSAVFYMKFLENLEVEVNDIKISIKDKSDIDKRNGSVIPGIMDGTIKPEEARPTTAKVETLFDSLEKEEPMNEKEAEADFRCRFVTWINNILKKYEKDENKKELDASKMTPDELDYYARLFFLLMTEEGHKKSKDDDSVKQIPELMLCIPEWPQGTISFELFYNVCKRELEGSHHLPQIYSSVTLPAKSIHTTMTYQQFSVLACGVSNVAVDRMIQSLKMAPNSSAVSNVNSKNGNSLYSRFNTWKDFTLGFVTGTSLFNGIKSSIPSEPIETITQFISNCVDKNSKKLNWDEEPVMFSVFGKLMRNEKENEEQEETENEPNELDEHKNAYREDSNEKIVAYDYEGTPIIEKKLSPEEEEEKECRIIKRDILEASGNSSDKVYDMLAYAAINNPPYKADVIMLDVIIRSIIYGLGVKLSPKQQAIVARRLRSCEEVKGNLVPVRLFMEKFGFLNKGPIARIPPFVSSPEHHGKFIRNAQMQSKAPTQPLSRRGGGEYSIKQNSSQNVIDVFQHQFDVPELKNNTPRRVEITGVQQSLIYTPEEKKPLPERKNDMVTCEITEDANIYDQKRKEFLEHASASEAIRKSRGYSNDLYRSEVPTPSRLNNSTKSSSDLMEALTWE